MEFALLHWLPIKFTQGIIDLKELQVRAIALSATKSQKNISGGFFVQPLGNQRVKHSFINVKMYLANVEIMCMYLQLTAKAYSDSKATRGDSKLHNGDQISPQNY